MRPRPHERTFALSVLNYKVIGLLVLNRHSPMAKLPIAPSAINKSLVFTASLTLSADSGAFCWM